MAFFIATKYTIIQITPNPVGAAYPTPTPQTPTLPRNASSHCFVALCE
jgi:hypothetical protein